jgi:hypothetical protein
MLTEVCINHQSSIKEIIMKNQSITLSLLECRLVYEDHFKKKLPGDLPFVVAASLVRSEVGDQKFLKMVKDLRESGRSPMSHQ